MVKNYLRNNFQKDLKTLKFSKLECIDTCEFCKYGFDHNTFYFGNDDWKNIENDIKYIDKSNYIHFFMCLFNIIFLDMGIFICYNEYYSIFRKKTMYPKFGNTGFGFSLRTPIKILEIPEKKEIININDITKFINEYVDIFINDCNDFFTLNKINISVNEFIKMIFTDNEILQDGESKIFEIYKKNIYEKIIG